MLTRQQRLRRSSDIQRVYETGQKAFHPFFRLIKAPGLTGQTRMTVVTSLRVSKKAIERNRLKRQLRAFWQKVAESLAKPYDCVIIVQPKAKGVSTAILEQALKIILKKQKLL